jgi:hypothetical protein
VFEYRADDGTPVLSVEPVTGARKAQQRCARDLLDESLAMREREHRVGGAVDHERGRRE